MRNHVRRCHPRGLSGNRGTTFVGILIGLILGLSIALGVAWYINRLPSPFPSSTPGSREPDLPPFKAETPPPKAADTGKDAAKDTAKDASKDPTKDATKDAKAPAKAADTVADKGAKSDKGDDGKKDAGGKELYYIQTGSFPSRADADNLKARLALLGLEAVVQSRTVPDKGDWFRVRVGPYTNVEELNNTRNVLTQNSIESVMVKVREAEK